MSLVSTIINKKRNVFLKGIGLAPWSFDTLSLLRRSKGKTLNPSQFMEELGITSGTMTHRIDILEQQGFVVRKKDNIDGRSINVELTDESQTVIEQAMKIQIYEADLLLSGFSEDEQKSTLNMLRRLLIKLKER